MWRFRNAKSSWVHADRLVGVYFSSSRLVCVSPTRICYSYADLRLARRPLDWAVCGKVALLEMRLAFFAVKWPPPNTAAEADAARSVPSSPQLARFAILRSEGRAA